MAKWTGFTLFEMIIVIVLIAIVAAYAVPRYINLTTKSQQTSTDNLAAALATASAENFAKRTANSNQGSPIGNCGSISGLLSTGALPSSDYRITSKTLTVGGTDNTCTLTGPGSTTATFRGLAIN